MIQKKEKVHFLRKFCEHTQRIHTSVSPKWGQSLSLKELEKNYLSIWKSVG